ncbi:MAG: hypothetical protein CL610_17360 [Anaerolineaceae bacterium]|nr:hypothetical protein [Anaerolineaceae bacterium]
MLKEDGKFSFLFLILALFGILGNQYNVASSLIRAQQALEAEALTSLQIDTRSLRTVLFSPNSQYFVTLKRYEASMDLWSEDERQQWLDNAIEVWSMSNFERLFALRGHTDQIVLLEFQPSGLHLASASEDGTVRLWNVETGKQVWSNMLNGNLVSDITFSSDGLFLAIVDGSVFPVSENNQVIIVDVQTGERVSAIAQAYAFVTVFSPDSGTLYVGGSDAKVHVWSLVVNNPQDDGQIFESSVGIPITDMTLNHTGELLAIDDLIGLHVIDTKSFTVQKTYDNPLDIDFARRHYGDVFAQITNNSTVHLFNIVTDQTWVLELELDQKEIMRAINTDNTLLISVNDDRVNVWDIETGNLISEVTHEDVFDATFSPDGSNFASWSASSGLLKIWHIGE